MDKQGKRASKKRLEEEMLEIKQGLLLTIVICHVCQSDRRIRVMDNRRGGIVAQLGMCPKCGAGSDDQLAPLANDPPSEDDAAKESSEPEELDDKKKPAAMKGGSRLPSVVTFQQSPSPPGPPEPIICKYCKMDPCIFTRLQYDIMDRDTKINKVNNLPSHPMGGVVRNRERRHRAFKYAAYTLYGFLGKGIRKKMPQCIEEGIRCLYPAYDGLHVGYKDNRK